MYNRHMENKIFAIKWGTGFWLLSHPYNSISCFKFVRNYDESDNITLVVSGQFLEELRSINCDKKVGIMTISINEGYVKITTSVTGGDHSTLPKKLINRRSEYYKSNKVDAINSLIDKTESPMSLKELRSTMDKIHKMCSYLAKYMMISMVEVWRILYDYNKAKIYHRRDKLIVFQHYGEGKIRCKRCGMKDIRALSIDHINGGGSKHLKEIRTSNMYLWLINNNFPTGYQVLCMNCQWIKRNENHETDRVGT
jgi:hypothetical protein